MTMQVKAVQSLLPGKLFERITPNQNLKLNHNKFVRSITACTASHSRPHMRDMSTLKLKSKILITTKIPEAARQKLMNSVDDIQHWNNEDQLIPKSQLISSVADVDGIYCILEDKIDKEVLDAAPRLKVVSTMSVGFDHIDINECNRRGIKVGNTPGILTETTADLAVALILATARRIPEAERAVKSGEWSFWKPEWMCGRDVHGSTVGIVGLGSIGEAVARRMLGFGCNIIYSGPREKPEIAKKVNARYVDFDTLLQQSDIITPHCPLTPQTKNLFSTSAFNKMKSTSIFVNTTRGGLVDQDALYVALKEKKIFAAGLDVTTPEPLPKNHKLLELPNLVVLPHIGSASIATRTNIAMMAADNLINGLSGKPLVNQVVPK